MAYETEDHETQYCFPAINSSCIKGKRSRYEYNIMYVLFSLLSAWTVLCLWHLIVMPVDAINLTETCWYFGHTFCRLFLIIMGLLISTSLSNLVLIAVDRYVAVCYPLLYPKKITATKTLISICLCWFYSSAYNNIGLSYGSVVSHRSDVCYGECPFIIHFALGVTDPTISFLFPCTLIITLYLRIFYVVHQQVKVINTLMKGGKCVLEGSVRRKSESKAALTLGIIMTAYLLCWIPYFILYITETTVSSATSDFLTWCLYLNSCLNPIIYALFYPWFRISVKYILTFQIFKPASSLVNVLTDQHL